MVSKDLSAKSVANGRTLPSSIIRTQGSTLVVESVSLSTVKDGGIYDALGRYLEKPPKHSDILKVKNNIIVSRRCAKCLVWHDIADYPLRKSGRYQEYCPVCRWEKGQEWSKNRRNRLKGRSRRKYRKTKRDADGVLMWQCAQCKGFFYDFEYHRDNVNNCVRRTCKYCYNKQYPLRGVRR
jgi:hypothetical protein